MAESNVDDLENVNIDSGKESDAVQPRKDSDESDEEGDGGGVVAPGGADSAKKGDDEGKAEDMGPKSPQEENQGGHKRTGSSFSNWGKAASTNLSFGLNKTKEGLGTAKTGFSLGFGYSKQWLLGKMGKASESPEDPDFLAMLDQLHVTNEEFTQLSKRTQQFADATRALSKSRGDFGKCLSKMGSGGGTLGPTMSHIGEVMQTIQTYHETLAMQFSEDFLVPINSLLENEIRDAMKREKQYKLAKLDYDACQSAVASLESTPGPKLEQAKHKLQLASDKYEQSKTQMKEIVELIDERKNNELQEHMVAYMDAQLSFFEKSHTYLAENKDNEQIPR